LPTLLVPIIRFTLSVMVAVQRMPWNRLAYITGANHSVYPLSSMHDGECAQKKGSESVWSALWGSVVTSSSLLASKFYGVQWHVERTSAEKSAMNTFLGGRCWLIVVVILNMTSTCFESLIVTDAGGFPESACCSLVSQTAHSNGAALNYNRFAVLEFGCVIGGGGGLVLNRQFKSFWNVWLWIERIVNSNRCDWWAALFQATTR